MRVVVPTWTVDERKGGIRTFLCHLVDALGRQPDVRLTLLCSRDSRGLFAGTGDGRELADLAPRGGPRLRPLTEQWTGARIDRHLGDVLLTPSNVGLLAAKIPQVVVVQAPLAVTSIRASHREVPVSAVHRAYHRSMLGISLRRAEAVVTVTEWMREQLLQSVRGLDAGRVHVVSEGVEAPTGDDARRLPRRGPPPRPVRQHAVPLQGSRPARRCARSAPGSSTRTRLGVSHRRPGSLGRRDLARRFAPGSTPAVSPTG